MPDGGLVAVLEANRALLLRFVRGRLADDPEDVIQELWLKVVERPPDRPIADPLGYLMRCAHNLIIDRKRSELQRTQREKAWISVRSEHGSDLPHSITPEQIVLARTELQHVEQTLKSLGERTRIIFYRYRLDGCSRIQIASELHLSVSAVEKHLTRAYRVLLTMHPKQVAGE